MSNRPPPTLGDLVSIVWDRRRLAGAVALAVVVPALLWIASQPRLYEAAARLVVAESRKTVDFQRDGEGLREFALVNTYRELLTSPGLLKSALEDAGAVAQEPYAGSADPGAILGARVRVLVNRDSWMLTVACKDEDPARAESLLGSLIEGFFGRLRAQHHGRGVDSAHFLQEQLTEARGRLTEANQREQEFRKLTGVISSDPRENHAYQRMQEMQGQRSDLDRRLGEAQTQNEQVNIANRLDPLERGPALLRIPGIVIAPAVAEHLQALRTLREREAQLGEKFLDKHPRMLEVRAQIADRNTALLTAATQSGTNIAAGLERLRAESSEVDTRLIEAETAARVYRDNLARLGVLEQETRSREEVVRHLAARAAEQEVIANLDDLQVAMVDPPAAGVRPVGLPRSLMSLLALMGAVGAGAAVAVAVDLLDRRVRSGAALGRAMDKPVLSDIPQCAASPRPGVSPDPTFDEAIRTLRTNLKFTLPNNRGAVVVVAPISTQAGATTTAAFLAGAIAAAGERVLLVDADMRDPGIESLLRFQGGPGLSMLLIGEPGISPVDTPMPNLALLGAGQVPPNPSELLNSHCLPEWLAHVRQTFDMIIIDAPALAGITGSSDALVLAEHADGIVLIARNQKTLLPEIAEAQELLRPVANKILGGVFTGFNPDHER